MELRALRYFVAVAEELHFGRAAERLHIAQPAVSQQIARLERELGVRLLDRSPRNVALTATGSRVLDAARDVLAAAERLRVVSGTPAVTLRIGTAAGLSARVERAIDTLGANGIPFDVVLVDLPFSARLDALLRGELDVALVLGEFSAPGLTALPNWTEPLLAVVSRHHHVAERTTVGLAELADGVFRMPARERDRPLHDAVTAALAAAGVRPKLGRPAESTRATIVEVGTTPHSWTLLPAGQVDEFASTRVRAIPLDPPVTITGSVVVPADGPGHSAACAAPAFGGDTDPPSTRSLDIGSESL